MSVEDEQIKLPNNKFENFASNFSCHFDDLCLRVLLDKTSCYKRLTQSIKRLVTLLKVITLIFILYLDPDCLRRLINPGCKSRKPEHKKILCNLWPEGSKQEIYKVYLKVVNYYFKNVQISILRP